MEDHWSSLLLVRYRGPDRNKKLKYIRENEK